MRAQAIDVNPQSHIRRLAPVGLASSVATATQLGFGHLTVLAAKAPRTASRAFASSASTKN